MTVPVQAASPGSAGNVQAGAITLIAAAIAGHRHGDQRRRAHQRPRRRERRRAARRASRTGPRASRARRRSPCTSAAAGVQQNVMHRDRRGPGHRRQSARGELRADGGRRQRHAPGRPDRARRAARSRRCGRSASPTRCSRRLVPAVHRASRSRVTGNGKNALIAAGGGRHHAFVDALPIGATLPCLAPRDARLQRRSGVTNVTGISVNGGIADLAPPLERRGEGRQRDGELSIADRNRHAIAATWSRGSRPCCRALVRRRQSAAAGRRRRTNAPVLTALLAGLATSPGLALRHDRAMCSCRRASAARRTPSSTCIGDRFFGAALPRRVNEGDDAFRARILAELQRARATRPALVAGAGRPDRAHAGDLRAGAPGRYRRLEPRARLRCRRRLGQSGLPAQIFVTAYRAGSAGIPAIAGWGARAADGAAPRHTQRSRWCRAP